jgi:hypothetical protein
MGSSPYPHVIAKVPAQLPVCRHADANVIAGGQLGFSGSFQARIAGTNEQSRQTWLDRHRYQLRAIVSISRRLSRLYARNAACCDAMRSEIKPGDVLLIEQTSGPGMTVRYRLPRPL